MGGIMRWIPQLPGLGEWARVVNYRRIQIDKLKNVEFIPSTDARRRRRPRLRRRDRRRRDRLVLGDRRLERLHPRHDPRRRRQPALVPDARADHARRERGARRQGADRRRRRLLHGPLAGGEARPRRQASDAHDPPRAHRAVHALHARGAEHAPEAPQAEGRDRHVPHPDPDRAGQGHLARTSSTRST